MSTTTTTVDTCIGPGAPGTPLYAPQLSSITSAAASSAGTQQYYTDQNVLYNFTTWLADQGDEAWTSDTDDNGNPCYFAVQFGGEGGQMEDSPRRVSSYRELMELDDQNAIYLILQTQPDTDAISGQKQPTPFSWNGQSYDMAGTITGTFSYNQQPSWYIEAPVGIITTVGLGILSKVLYSSFIAPLVTSFWNGVKKSLSSGAESTNLDGVEAATEAGAEAAAVDGATVAEGTAINVVASATAFCGMAILVAIPIMLDLLAHPTYQTLTVYNLTPYTLKWSIGYQDEGAMTAAPVMGQGSTTLNPTILPESVVAPPGLQPVTMASEANFGFASTSNYIGVGYVMAFSLEDATTGDVVTTAAALFDVPNEGQNSLYATFDPSSTDASFYNAFQNQYQQGQMTASSPDVSLQLDVTFDYLDGKHGTPSGQEAYSYNSMAVFSVPTSS